MKTKTLVTAAVAIISLAALLVSCGGGGGGTPPGGGNDKVPPTVSSVIPASASTDVAINSVISVSFSEAMDSTSITESTFMVNNGNNGVVGVVTYDDTYHIATFTPSADLSYNTIYTVVITTEVKDAAGNTMAENYSCSFTTAQQPDNAPPEIYFVTPYPGATDVPSNAVITAVFTEAMDALTITEATFIVTSSSGGSVSGSVTYYADTKTATFTPTNNLYSNSTYTATITTGAEDTAGNSLLNNFSWSFTTGARPKITSTTPVSGATGIAVDATITAQFSEKMNSSTIDTSTFILKDSSNNQISGTVSYSPGSSGFPPITPPTPPSATFKPTDYLAYNTTYTATITTGAKDLTGDPLASNYTWSFTTAPDVAPTVTSTSPANNAKNVSITTKIYAYFSEQIAAATINASTFYVTSSGASVSGSVSYDAAYKRAVFTPASDLSYGTVYTATITTGVLDLTGYPLAADYTWSFTTSFGIQQLGSASTDEGNVVSAASDVNKDVYVAGMTYGSLGGKVNAGNADMFVVKYNSTGVMQWVNQLGTAGADAARGIVTDRASPNCNIYVAGYTYGGLDGNINAGGSDIFLIKYNSSGVKQWTKQLGTASTDSAFAAAAYHSFGYTNAIYVTGTTLGGLDGNASAGGYDIFLVGYATNGNKLWTKQLGSASNDHGRAVTVDGSGNVYVAGDTSGSLDGNTNAGGKDIFLTKYNSSGTKQWTKQLGSASDDVAYGVAVDKLGKVYVTGYTYGNLDGNANLGGADIFITQYDADGAKQWTKLFGTASDDVATGIAAEAVTTGAHPGNYMYVTGYTKGGLGGKINAGVNDAFVFEYKEGSVNPSWINQFGSSANDYAFGIAPDSSFLNLYIAGFTYGALSGANAGGADIFVVKVDHYDGKIE